ncbi:BAG family molecular chaperone regulator 1 [Linum perenne]
MEAIMKSLRKDEIEELEIRPGGMLVQKRDPDSEPNSLTFPVVPMIRVKVKFGSSYHRELKKLLTEVTGVHHQDQKLMYKKKEKDSRMYLDIERVKDGSKIVLIDDITSREKRCLEMIKSSRLQKVSKSIEQITTEVDTLVHKVTSLEATSSRGGIVAEIDIDDLTEALMSRLVELDEILVVDGTLKLQKTTQERRIQKYIESLDVLKSEVSSSKLPMKQRKVAEKHSEAAVITAKWETFD